VLLTHYADQGLRLIEIERDDLSDLPEIQKLIEKRPEKFIVYCDDLAFNAEDENYRSLKSVLDGSLQSGSVILLFMLPVTVVIYCLNLCTKTRP
jgi:Predicted ATPase (AAA+ superfamily)